MHDAHPQSFSRRSARRSGRHAYVFVAPGNWHPGYCIGNARGVSPLDPREPYGTVQGRDSESRCMTHFLDESHEVRRRKRLLGQML